MGMVRVLSSQAPGTLAVLAAQPVCTKTTLLSRCVIPHGTNTRLRSKITRCCSERQEANPLESDSRPREAVAPTTEVPSSSRSDELLYSTEPQPLRGLVAVLAGAGVVETAYLTWMKLAGGPITCPLGGGTCGDVLNSEYGTLFGLPLTLYGFAAYTTALILSQLDQPGEPDRGSWRWLLLGTTSAMAAASTYFMYILNFKLTGYTCTYCVASAILSFSLLLSSLKGFSGAELRKAAAPQLGLGLGVVLALSLAFGDVRSALAGSGELDWPLVEPQVTTVSQPDGIALAKHLKAVGAKMYGAFWCSHCFEQKQMFGAEAMKYVDYVECYPEGYRRGANVAKACIDAKIEGFPSWVIDGKLLSGEQGFEDLARASKFQE